MNTSKLMNQIVSIFSLTALQCKNRGKENPDNALCSPSKYQPIPAQLFCF